MSGIGTAEDAEYRREIKNFVVYSQTLYRSSNFLVIGAKTFACLCVLSGELLF